MDDIERASQELGLESKAVNLTANSDHRNLSNWNHFVKTEQYLTLPALAFCEVTKGVLKSVFLFIGLDSPLDKQMKRNHYGQ